MSRAWNHPDSDFSPGSVEASERTCVCSAASREEKRSPLARYGFGDRLFCASRGALLAAGFAKIFAESHAPHGSTRMSMIDQSSAADSNDSTADPFDYRSAARAILPRLAATTDSSDRLRRLNDDAAAALRESGLARILTPKRFGGLELSPSAHIWTCAELSHACPAASWVLMVCVAHDYIVGRFPEACQKEVYGDGADNLVAGALAPQGAVARVTGGWRLNGRWQFGSGCDHSDWFIMGARMMDPSSNDYLVRHVMVPRADMEIDDTWHTLGMRGTGSKDLLARDVFVPEYRSVPTFPTFVGLSPHAKTPIYRLPVYAGLSSMLSGSVLGIAERGLKAFIEHTAARKNAYGVVKSENAGMQRRIAESSAEIAEARRLLENICQRFDVAMVDDQAPMSPLDRAQFRWDAAYIVELSRRAIERVFAAFGAHGIYEGNPVLRAYRDINTACHHAVVDFDTVSEIQGRAILFGNLNENPRAAPFA
jgi:alkylation response protein AidB-like acyl-CoA dehydrogenase